MLRKLKRRLQFVETSNNASSPPLKRYKQANAIWTADAGRAKTPKLIVDDDGEDEDFDLAHNNRNHNGAKQTVQASSSGHGVDAQINHTCGFQFTANPVVQVPNGESSKCGKEEADAGGMDQDEDEDEDDDLAGRAALESSVARTSQDQQVVDDEDEDEDIDLVGEDTKDKVSSGAADGAKVQGQEKEKDKSPETRLSEEIRRKRAEVHKLAHESLQLQRMCGDEAVHNHMMRLNKERARLMNEVERLSKLTFAGRWCLKFCPAPLKGQCLFVPDVGRFTRVEYEQHKEHIRRLSEEEDRRRESAAKEEQEIRLRETKQLVKMAAKIKPKVGRRGPQYRNGKWDSDKDVWEFKDEQQRGQYGTAVMDAVDWFNEHQNAQYHDNKFGAILWEKSGNSFLPVFSRVTAEEYARSEQRFQAEMKAHRDDIMWEVKNDSNPIYRRVIDMDI